MPILAKGDRVMLRRVGSDRVVCGTVEVVSPNNVSLGISLDVPEPLTHLPPNSAGYIAPGALRRGLALTYDADSDLHDTYKDVMYQDSYEVTRLVLT